MSLFFSYHRPSWIHCFAGLCGLAAVAAFPIPIRAGNPASLPGDDELRRLNEMSEGYPIPVGLPLAVMDDNFPPEKKHGAENLRDYFYFAYLLQSGEDARVLELLKARPADEATPYRMRLLEVRVLYSQGDQKTALSRCRKLVKDVPDEADGYLLLSDLCSQAGDRDSVIETLEAGHKALPKQGEVLQRLHRQYAKKFGEATSQAKKREYLDHLEKISEEIVEAMPGRPSAPYVRALAFIKMENGKTKEAVELMRRLVVLEPRDIEHYIQLSQFLEQTRDTDGAVAALRRASVVNPADPDLTQRLNALLLSSGHPDALLEFYKSLAAEYPGRADIQLAYAKNLVIQSRQKEAVQVLRDSLQLQPDNPDGWLLLVELEFSLQHRDLGVEAAGKYLEHAAPTGDNLARVAQMLLKYDCFDEAASRLAELKALDPNHPAIQNLELVTAVRKGDHEKALGLLKAAIEAHPEEITSYILLVRVFEQINRVGEAIPFLEKGLEHASGENAQALRELLVSAYDETDRYEDAIRTAGESLEANPANWQMRILRLRLYMKTGQKQEIEPELAQVLKNHQNDPEVQYEAALVKWDLKQFEDATACLRRAIALKPDFAEALNSLGYLFAERDSNLDEALNLVQKALTLEPNAAHMIDSLGWIYYKKGDYTTAVATLEQAATKMKDDPVVLDHLGDAYVKMDRPSEALDRYQRAVQGTKDEELAKSLKKKIESLKKP